MSKTLEQRNWSEYARRVLTYALNGIDLTRAQAPSCPAEPYGGAFVTLRKFGKLRGCIGSLDGSRPLHEAIREAAINAALNDPRFPPLSFGELPDVTIEVSILSKAQRLPSLDELRIGEHGILVRRGEQRGLFLPKVATEYDLDRETFLSRCCKEKAGLPEDAWKDPETEIYVFTAEVYAETPAP
jgi:AmmeMemoRadiSam system protein A